VKLARSVGITLISLTAVWLILCAIIGVFAVEGALHPIRRELSQSDELRAAIVAAETHSRLSAIEVTAADGAVLRAWSIRPIRGTGDYVILLHGQGDNRSGMLGPAGMLLKHGFAVLLPDGRAHGTSGGAIGTYGVFEADDLRRWFDWLKTNQSPRCINALGDSMGGAEVLRSLDVEHDYCAVVAESPFATFQEAAFDRLGQQFSTGPWLGRRLLRPAFGIGLAYARLKYRVDLGQASPKDAVAASHVPVLLIHGLADTNLPPRHSEMIKRANSAVVLWEPANADHCEASKWNPRSMSGV
jgi:hypothetical protein